MRKPNGRVTKVVKKETYKKFKKRIELEEAIEFHEKRGTAKARGCV